MNTVLSEIFMISDAAWKCHTYNAQKIKFLMRCMQVHDWKAGYPIRVRWKSKASSGSTVEVTDFRRWSLKCYLKFNGSISAIYIYTCGPVYSVEITWNPVSAFYAKEFHVTTVISKPFFLHIIQTYDKLCTVCKIALCDIHCSKVFCINTMQMYYGLCTVCISLRR